MKTATKGKKTIEDIIIKSLKEQITLMRETRMNIRRKFPKLFS